MSTNVAETVKKKDRGESGRNTGQWRENHNDIGNTTKAFKQNLSLQPRRRGRE